MSGNQIAIQIGDSRPTRILRYEQIAAFGKHTVAVLDLPIDRKNSVMATEWTPVQTSMSSDGQTARWYGYVHHTSGVSSIQDTTGSTLRYTFIGTSLTMNTERTRSWKEVSASALARQIGHEHRLRTVISPTRKRLPYYAQTGSDWSVLKDLAAKTGNRLWVDGANLMLLDPAVLLQTAQSRDIPAFLHNRVPGRVDTVFEWYSKAGTMVPREGGRALPQVVTGLDLRSGSLVRAKGSVGATRPVYQSGALVPSSASAQVPIGPDGVPLLGRVSTGTRVASMGEANDVATADAKNAQGWVTATARVKFSPTLTPGRVIEVQGTAIPSDQTGYWLVTGVSQRLLQDGSDPLMKYSTELELERNSRYTPTFASSFASIGTYQTVYATMRNGLFWEAQFMEDVNVG